MNLKKIAFTYALIGLSSALFACNSNSVESAKKSVEPAKITDKSTDDQKFAYMLGAQFGGQYFTIIPRQMGEELNEDAVVQAIRDNTKANEDSNFKVQIIPDTLRAVGARYNAIARKRVNETRPDSATMASFQNDSDKIRAYIDSVAKSQPIAKSAPYTGAAVTVLPDSPDNTKFSYLLGLQFADQLMAIGEQFKTEFSSEYFILGVHESVKNVADSSFVMQFPKDSLKAIGERYQEKMQKLREEAFKEQQEAEAKLKKEIAPLRGDTLANGMPKKMNFKVKATNISVNKAIATKVENLEAFANKPLLIFYFSASCPHCGHAAPEVFEIAKEFEQKGLVTLAFASSGNNKKGIREFIDNAKWSELMNVVWDKSREFGELYSDGYVPKVYLVNPDGTYKLYAAFENEREDLKKDIEGLLSGKNVEWTPEAPKAPEASTVENK